MKKFKEKPDRPVEEIPTSFMPNIKEGKDENVTLEHRQFTEEESVHFQSKENKKIRKRDVRLNKRLIRIVKPRLHKEIEKRLFYLYFDLEQDYYRISKILKIEYDVVRQQIRKRLRPKVKRIYKCYQLFKELKPQIQKIATEKQFEFFDLYYNKCVPWKKMKSVLSIDRRAIKERKDLLEKKIKEKLEPHYYSKYLKLKKNRDKLEYITQPRKLGKPNI